MENKLFSEIEVNLEVALECGLSEEEYNKVLSILGRKPTYTEIGVYGVMWSEHCSYKNSIKLLKTLPRKGGRLLVEAGEENAGLVDIGGGYAICFKIESHNHPSAIEPFQGAATGVGGILRDIFSMGARPIAALNSLRFGELSSERVSYLLKGVVGGISHYGNSFGVPTVAGEIYFDDCYLDNPLVNAMAVGIVRTERIAKASATGNGNPVFIVGSSTGRDGIHGASLLASREFDEKTEDMRPTVQVGDPFAEKLLLEATLELIKSGVVIGVQDMGAAGISCSTSEMSARGKSGMVIDLDKVPLREKGMTAYEIMLSESQERMLFVIDKDKVDKAVDICKKWDVPIEQIGNVTDTGILEIYYSGNKVCNLPADSLVLGGGAPQYDRETKFPSYLELKNKITDSDLENKLFESDILKSGNKFETAFWNLLSAPNIASKRWVYEQYDSQVRTNTVSIKGDAAIMRLKELPGKGIALSVDCNSRYVYLNPYLGAMIAVAEAARNVACVGAEPIAITNCLNFGNPYDPEVYWTFSEAIKGMGDACRFFNTPVTGGNVSFHNESRNRAIFPTPTIGMLGLIDNLENICQAGFKNDGDYIFLIGNNRTELGGSEIVKLVLGDTIGKCPQLNLEEERRLQQMIIAGIRNKLINSAHDCSEGGLLICLAEKSIFSSNHLGADVKLDNLSFGLLFGESQSRIIVTVSSSKENEFKNLCEKNNIYLNKIGVVTVNDFKIEDVLDTTVNRLTKAYEQAIPKFLE